jgi:hypothetical protein
VLEEGRFGARGLEATFGVTIAHRQQAMAMQRLDAHTMLIYIENFDDFAHDAPAVR